MFKKLSFRTVQSAGMTPSQTKSYRSKMGSAHFALKEYKAENV